MSNSILKTLAFLLSFSALAGSVAAQEGTLSWIPSTSPDVVGYNVYMAPSGAGPLAAVPIDVGNPQPNGSGIASIRLTGVDRTSRLRIEMTSYDWLGRESARSNRVYLLGDGETVAQPIRSQDFEDQIPGIPATGFADWGGTSAVLPVLNGNLALVLQMLPSSTGLVLSRYVAPNVWVFARYDIEGRLFLPLITSVGGGSLATGVAVRVGPEGLGSAFILGGDMSGEFALDQIGMPDLRCASSASTGVPVVRNEWLRFRLRYTTPDGRARLRAKVWMAAELEPSLWQADCWTDTPPSPDSGDFAFYQAGVGRSYWDDLAVRIVSGPYSPIPSN